MHKKYGWVAAFLGSGAGNLGFGIGYGETRVQQDFKSMEGHVCGVSFVLLLRARHGGLRRLE